MNRRERRARDAERIANRPSTPYPESPPHHVHDLPFYATTAPIFPLGPRPLRTAHSLSRPAIIRHDTILHEEQEVPAQGELRSPAHAWTSVPDIVYNVALFASELIWEASALSDVQVHVNLPNSAFDARSSVLNGLAKDVKPSTVAYRLSLVCKTWFEVVHSVMFRAVSLGNMEMRDWTTMAASLADPPFTLARMRHLNTPIPDSDDSLSSGSIVKRLELPVRFPATDASLFLGSSYEHRTNVYTDSNPNPWLQTAIHVILRSCPNLQHLILTVNAMEAVFGSHCFFMRELRSTFSTFVGTLHTLSIQIPVDAASSVMLLDVIGGLENLLVLVLRQACFVQGRYDVTAFASHTLVHLHTLSLFCIDCGSFPFLRIFSLWSLPNVSSLLYRGTGRLTGLEEFVSRNNSTLTNVMIDYLGRPFPFHAVPKIPSTSNLTHVVVSYNFGFEFLSSSNDYSAVEYVGLTGRLSHSFGRLSRRTDMVMMRQLMVNLFREDKYPNLIEIQFINISEEEAKGGLWHLDDAAMWRSWHRASRSPNRAKRIELIDAKGVYMFRRVWNPKTYGRRGDDILLSEVSLI